MTIDPIKTVVLTTWESLLKCNLICICDGGGKNLANVQASPEALVKMDTLN